MEEENQYEMITLDNQCYNVLSSDKPQNPSGSEKRVPSRDEPQNLSRSEKQVPSRDEPQNLSAYEDLESQYRMPACSWMCFILLVGFILVGSAAFISLGLTSWNINSNLRTQTMGLQASNVAELERRLTQLQVSVNNNTSECERKILELRNLSNDSISELERSLIQLQIFENNRNDIQSNISKSLDSKLNNIIRSLTGQYSNLPADSCSLVLQLNSSSPSGHYWIRSSNGSAVRVYCDMTRSCGNITGGWMRVASLNWSNESLPCPDEFKERSDSDIRTCGINSTSTGLCSSLIFKTHSTVYSRVCGKINAYQFGTPDAFSTIHGRGSNITIDSNYVDGVSLTHGNNPRRHIWTFAATYQDGPGLDLLRYPGSTCQCVRPNDTSIMTPPSFVGMDYFCDTASRDGLLQPRFFPDDPLWDGAGCASTSTCCSFNNPPWFHKQLPSATTDDIEMRVCCDESGEDIAISNVKIYVQ